MGGEVFCNISHLAHGHYEVTVGAPWAVGVPRGANGPDLRKPLLYSQGVGVPRFNSHRIMAIRCHQETTMRHGDVHREQLPNDLMAPFRTTTEAHKHKMATDMLGKGTGKVYDPIWYRGLIF